MITPIRHRNQGVALIIVLSFVVLVAAVVVAFTSRAQSTRKISANNTGGVRADSIGKAALDVVIGDLRDEIIRGSSRTDIPFTPSSMATVFPLKSAGGTNQSILKVSSVNPTFSGSNYTRAGYSRGTGSTLTPSGNGRLISQHRWAAPQFGKSDGTDLPAPAWIYVTELGDMGFDQSQSAPLPFAENEITVLRANGTRPAVGRFAYVIYNIGTLLDINVAGNQLAMDLKSRKGRLHQADITAIPGLTDSSDANELLSWRTPPLPNEDATGGLFDPLRNFISVAHPASDQVFLSRRDLIAYAKEKGMMAALPYLTIFSRESNAPAWNTLVTTPASSFRPNLPMTSVSFIEQRFPLSRLRNFGSLSSAELSAWFGLEWDGGQTGQRVWVYGDRNSPFTKIKSFDQVKAEKRQPNFFEILKNIIGQNGLGDFPSSRLSDPAQTAAANYTQTLDYEGNNYTADQKRLDAHIFQIGANIIDQYDEDDIPTDIFVHLAGNGAYATDVQNPANRFIGIENLPYLSRVAAIFESKDNTTSGKKELRVWLQPEFANPHSLSLKRSIIAKSGFPFTPTGNIRVRMIGDVQLHLEDGRGSPTTSPPFTYTLTAGTFPFTSVSKNEGIIVRNVSTFPADVATEWNPVQPLAGTASPLGGAFYTTEAEVITDTSVPTYKLSIQGGTTPLSFILEYEAEDSDDNNNLVWRPYAIWQDFKPGIDTRLTVESTNGNKLHDATKTPAWIKSDPRTERSTSRVDKEINMNDAPTLPVGSRIDRPFRSVGELGYVFRDAPNTTSPNLSFALSDSPNAALLEFFSVDDAKVVGGKVALNSRISEVLEAVLRDTGTNASNPLVTLTTGNATTYASSIMGYTFPAGTNIEGRGSLARMAAPITTPYNTLPEKDAPIRALAEVANTRTWNVMIDVIAQAGRIPKDATGNVSSKFMVEGERRYWMHVAIDRYTGQIVGTPIIESVQE